MKILRQVVLIFVICVICEGLSALLPFPFPGSVLSMLLLFVLLLSRKVRLEQIKETSDFLLGNMLLVFVPSLVSIMNHFDLLRAHLAPFFIIVVVSTVLTFGVTAGVVCLVTRLQRGKGETHG